MDQDKSDSYWASQSADQLASYLLAKDESWLGQDKQLNILEKQQQSYDYYYGNHFKNASSGGTAIKSIGPAGAIKLVSANHYRNLLRHMLVMTTSQRPAFDCQAINSDLKSLQQARLGNSILDAYLKEKRIGRYLKRAAESGLVLGKGFLYVQWDKSLGLPYGVSRDDQGNENIVHEGDVRLTTLFPHQVRTDPGLDDFASADWVRIKLPVNKWNLIAKYPELKDRILSLPALRDDTSGQFKPYNSQYESDSIVVINAFYHLRTEAMPNGRYLLFGDSASVFEDLPIPYSRLPVFRIVPGEILGTAEGYTEGFDLLTLQEVIDVLISTAFTNQNANGIQKIFVPEGSSVSTELLSQGLIIIKGPKGMEPTPINLTATSKEVYELLGLAEKYAETISGINSVARGNPESSLKSGVALGLVQSMAIQFASGFQESWVELLEDVGSFILTDCLKPFAKSKRFTAMAGKHQRAAMKAWMGEDLAGVKRVTVNMGNPLMRTTAGRVQVADNLLGKGLVTTPQEYLNLIDTGQVEPMTQGPLAKLDRIRQENEMLMEGKPVQALVSDSHLLDLQEHNTVINDPMIRAAADAGDEFAKNVLLVTTQHMEQHKQLYQTQDPLWSMVAGEPPAPPPPRLPGAVGPDRQPLPPEAAPPPDSGGMAPPAPPMIDEPIPSEAPPLPPGAQPITGVSSPMAFQ